MTKRLPEAITRGAFLNGSMKLAIGAAGLIAGSTWLFYAEAVRQRRKPTAIAAMPAHFAKLGSLQALASGGVHRIAYQAAIEDAWVRHEVNGVVYATAGADGRLLILSADCTHLGCKIDPAPAAERSLIGGLYFRCPCHGAEFDLAGNAAESFTGLPPLDRYEPLMADGEVYIDVRKPIKGRAGTGTDT